MLVCNCKVENWTLVTPHLGERKDVTRMIFTWGKIYIQKRGLHPLDPNPREARMWIPSGFQGLKCVFPSFVNRKVDLLAMWNKERKCVKWGAIDSGSRCNFGSDLIRLIRIYLANLVKIRWDHGESVHGPLTNPWNEKGFFVSANEV